MKRIRIGKDIEIHWPILTNGEQVTLEGRDLHLVLHLPSCMETPLHFEPQGNIAVFTISGNMQKQLGAYRLTMWEIKIRADKQPSIIAMRLSWCLLHVWRAATTTI